MNIYSLPALISFTINISVALIIILEDPKADLNRWFSSFLSLFAFWNLSEIVILNVHNSSNAVFAAHILYRIIFLVPAFFVIIAYKFPKSFHKFSHKFIFYFAVISIPILILALSFSGFEIQIVKLGSSENTFYYRINYNDSFAFLSQIFVSFVYFVWGIIVLYKKLPKLKTVKQKNQTLFFTFGFLTILLLFVIINAFRPLLEQAVSFYFLSTLLTFLISLFFLYVILHYKIFTIRRIIRSGIIYSALSSIVLAIYVLVIQGLSSTVSEYFRINSFFFTALLIIFLVFLMRPLERKLQNFLDIFLRKDITLYRHNFSIFTHQLQEYKSLDKFFELVKEFIDKNFFAGSTLLFLVNEEREIFYNEKNPKDNFSINKYKYFINSLVEFKRAVEINEFNLKEIDTELLKFFEKNNIQVIQPFIFENKLLAIIFIGKKKYADRFTEDEIERLTIMSDEISLALHRNVMFENLQQKIKQQYRLEKLASIGQMTAGIAHEIRNPLNTISLSVQTLTKPEINSEDRNELMKYISEELERLERILQDFLKLSRQRDIQNSEINFEELIDRVILALESKNNKSITIEKKIKSTIPNFKSDADFLYQSLLNLGLNALDAVYQRCNEDKTFNCKKGKIRFFITTENEYLIIIVKDNGIGINEEKCDKIFEPFFTTKEEGTGLGLAIVHNLVQMLGGTIQCKSEHEDTSFTIKINKNTGELNERI